MLFSSLGFDFVIIVVYNDESFKKVIYETSASTYKASDHT